MELKHSPLPWVFNPMDKYGKYPEYSCNVIVDSNNDAIMGDESYYPWAPDEDTMQFIVQACNSYYETKQLLSQANRREELLREALIKAKIALERTLIYARADGVWINSRVNGSAMWGLQDASKETVKSFKKSADLNDVALEAIEQALSGEPS